MPIDLNCQCERCGQWWSPSKAENEYYAESACANQVCSCGACVAGEPCDFHRELAEQQGGGGG